jgi:hypothetical protein
MQMQATKRPREETAKAGTERQAKRERGEEEEEEMEIDEDEEGGKPGLSFTIFSCTRSFTES